MNKFKQWLKTFGIVISFVFGSIGAVVLVQYVGQYSPIGALIIIVILASALVTTLVTSLSL